MLACEQPRGLMHRPITRRQSLAAAVCGVCAAPAFFTGEIRRAQADTDVETILSHGFRFPDARQSQSILIPDSAPDSKYVGQLLWSLEDAYIGDSTTSVIARCHIGGLLGVGTASVDVELTVYDIAPENTPGTSLSLIGTVVEKQTANIDVTSDTNIDLKNEFSITELHLAYSLTFSLLLMPEESQTPYRYPFSNFDCKAYPARVKNGIAYPVNGYGYTFGASHPIGGIQIESSFEAVGPDTSTDPDLILVQSELGTEGYAYKQDLMGSLPASPDEALDMMVNQDAGREVNVYLSDGKTRVGTFFVQSGL